MSAEEPGPSSASCCPNPPQILNSWLGDEDEEEDEKDEEEREGQEAKSQRRSSSGESEESESEPPPASATRRKVSFADAFGLDLVSVKEFDSTAETRPENLMVGEAREGEEYHISCLFTLPASDEELAHRLRQNKLELESLELMPGSTTVRGVVRVLNVSFHKAVYVRTTLDGWQSHFDLLAEYVPGSSDGETDRFTFKLTLVPPFLPEGVQVEFCLRYESAVGTFWASNGGMNYVLFCRQRGGSVYGEREGETEENSHRGKRSCLKAIRKSSYAEAKPTSASGDLPEPDSSRSEETEEGKTQREVESRSGEALRECRKALAERRCRRRAARLARIQDYFSQRTEAESEDGENMEITKRGLKVSLPSPQISNPVDTSNVLPERSKKEQDETPPILTYHQIPLLSLDWGKQTANSSLTHTPENSSGTNTNVPERHLMGVSTGSTLDVWEAFLKETVSSDRNTNAVDQQLCSEESDALLPSHTECKVSVPGDKRFLGKILTRTADESVNESPECFNGKETPESSSIKLCQDFKPSHGMVEVLGYEHEEKQGIISESQVVQELQTDQEQCGTNMSGVNVTPEVEHTTGERLFNESVNVSVTNEVETVQIIDGGVRQSSKTKDAASPEECYGCLTSSDTMDVTIRENSNHSLLDRLAERKEDIGSKQSDEQIEKGQTTEDKDNKGQKKTVISWSECFEEPALELESGKQGEDEEPPHQRDKGTEPLAFPMNECVVFNEIELHKWTECLNQEMPGPEAEEDVMYPESVKEGATETNEREREEILSVIEDSNVAKGECETSKTKAESLIRFEGATEDEACIDTITDKGIHKPQNTTVICIHTSTSSITDHNNDPSEPFNWTESSREDPLLFSSSHLKGIDWGETLSLRVVQDLQDINGEVESPAPVSRTVGHSTCSMVTGLLAWWTGFCALGYISRAIVYSILFAIFITVYMHDLPVCLAIYMLSVCWWCGHGMRKRVATADSVD